MNTSNNTVMALDLPISLKVVLPKVTKATLVKLKNTLAVQNGELFDYYPLKLGETVGNYVELEVRPSVLKEGYVCIDKKFYKLTFKDLLKGKLNVSREYIFGNTKDNIANSERSEGSNQSAKPAPASARMGQPSTDTDEPGLSRLLEDKINKDAYLAWADQISTLLDLED